MKKMELFFTFILLPLDIVMTLASFVLAYKLRGHLEIGNAAFSANSSDYVALTLYFIPALIIIYALNGLYNSKINKGLAYEFYKIFESNSAAFALLILVLFFTKTSVFSRFIILLTWAFGILLVYLARAVVRISQRLLLKHGIGRKNVIVIGANETAEFIASEIKKHPWEGYKFVGAIDSHDRADMKVLGDISDFKEISKNNAIDVIVATGTGLPKADLAEIVDFCGDHHLSFKFVPNISADLALKVYGDSIGSMPVFEIKTTPLDGWGRIVKRISDIILSAFLLLVLSPFFLIIAILEKLTSRGPVFYSHQRVGRDGKTFMLYKFRSMYLNAENKVNKFWTDSDAHDPRITPFGKFLRKSNLDELPQLFNIFIGNMSFVGPRPEQPRWVEKFSSEMPDYIKRHRVKSGLTGWAQVNGLKGDTSIPERVRYDMFYIENWSVWFDLKIMLRTMWLIIYEIVKGKYEYRSGS